MSVPLAAPVSTNVRLTPSLKAKSIKLTLTSAPIAALAQMFARLKRSSPVDPDQQDEEKSCLRAAFFVPAYTVSAGIPINKPPSSRYKTFPQLSPLQYIPLSSSIPGNDENPVAGLCLQRVLTPFVRLHRRGYC